MHVCIFSFSFICLLSLFSPKLDLAICNFENYILKYVIIMTFACERLSILFFVDINPNVIQSELFSGM